MELRQLRTFRLVSSTRSFTQAALLLNYAQSSVTAQIQTLEKELGVQLFDRLGRGVQLTEAGRQLLGYANQILDLVDETQAAVAGTNHVDGMLSVGAPETICTYRLPTVLRQFRDRFPQVRLSFRPMLDAHIITGVRNGSLDVGVLLQSPLQTNSFQVEPLIEEAVLVISPTTHRLADSDMVKPGDLEGETILLTETGCGYRHLFERSLAGGQVYNVIKLEFSSVEAIKQSVMAGLGIGFLPRVAVQEELLSGHLCALKWEKPYIISTQLIYHPDKWKSPAMAAFVELCRAEIGKGNVPGTGSGRVTGFV